MKKERSFENVRKLIEQLIEITKINFKDIDTIIVDTISTNDKVIDELNVHLQNIKNQAKIISLNGMNISSINTAKEKLPAKSRALIITNSGSGDTTVALVSNNPKDIKISKYIYGKFRIG